MPSDVPREPLPDPRRPIALTLLLATRPAFLLATVAAAAIGLATAARDGAPIDALAAFATVLFAACAHAGTNVLNDYFDSRSGCDAINTGRIYPFTGGSRFIQNGVLGERQTLLFGSALLACVVPAGLVLAWASGPGLLAIGALGLAIGWAYSAPPLSLASRGLGEAGVAFAYLLIVAGADYVQRGEFAATPWLAALPYALLASNLLYVNQFPDREADLAAGKRHWVARLGPARARWGYPLIASAAAAALGAAVLAQRLPAASAWAALALLPAALASADLLRHAERPERLGRAIRATIAALLGFGSLLAASIALAG